MKAFCDTVYLEILAITSAQIKKPSFGGGFEFLLIFVKNSHPKKPEKS